MLKLKNFFKLSLLNIFLSSFFTLSCSLNPSPPAARMVVFENPVTCGEDTLSQIRHFVREKNYKAAILSASAILDNLQNKEVGTQVTRMLAGIFEEKGDFDNAICFYMDAFKTASDKSLKEEILNSAVTAGLNLDANSLVSLLSGAEPDATTGARLLYETAVMHRDAGKYENALTLIHGLSENFSQFREAYGTGAMIKDIEDRKRTKRETIGVILPLSGKLQKFGQKALSAIQLAIEDFNASQHDFSFRIIVEDSGIEEQTTLRSVRFLKEQGAICIIGPMLMAEPAAVESNKLGMPILLLTQKEDLPAIGKFVFRNFITPHLQASTLAAYFIEECHYTRFAVMYPDSSYGKIFSASFDRAISAYGGDMVQQTVYPPGATDFSDQIKDMVRGYETLNNSNAADNIRKRNRISKALVDFDVLFIPDSLKVVNLIAPQLKFHGIDDIILSGTNIWYSEQFSEMDGKYLENAVFPVGFYPETEMGNAARYLNRYKEKTGEAPSYIDAIAYDTASHLMKILSMEDVQSKDDLIKALGNTFFPNGATFPLSFDRQGEPNGALHLLTVKNEKIVLLKPADSHQLVTYYQYGTFFSAKRLKRLHGAKKP